MLEQLQLPTHLIEVQGTLEISRSDVTLQRPADQLGRRAIMSREKRGCFGLRDRMTRDSRRQT